MSVTITRDEWLKALEQCAAASADGMTAEEIAKLIGFSVEITRQKIRRAIGSGTMEFAGTRRVMRMDQRPGTTPVYRLKSKPKR